MDTLLGHLDSVRSRSASNAVGLNNVRLGREGAKKHPDAAQRCGVAAVHRLAIKEGALTTEAHLNLKKALPQGGQGFSLNELAELSTTAGISLHPVHRENPSSSIPLPSIVHWNLGHYAILLEKRGGGYLVDDPGFRRRYVVTEEVLNEESSGFFLTASESLDGFRNASAEESKSIRGGYWFWFPNLENDECPCECESGCRKMAGYILNRFNPGYTLRDTPIWSDSPLTGSIEFTANWIHNGQYRAKWDEMSHMGDENWFVNWSSVLYSDTPSTDDVEIWLPDGRKETYYWNSGTTSFERNRMSNAKLVKSGSEYTLTTADGTEILYKWAITGGGYGTRYYISEIKYPDGNYVWVYHDSSGVKYVYDTIGNGLEFAHKTSTKKIEYVKDKLNTTRKATVAYNTSGVDFLLDPEGIKSQFNYTGSVIDELVTPYGTTTFSTGSISGGDGSWCKVEDPEGLFEKAAFISDNLASYYFAGTYGVDAESAEWPSGTGWDVYDIERGTSLYWDKKAMKDYPEGNSQHYYRAAQTHWTDDPTTDEVFPIPSSTRTALTSRVFYKYPGTLYYGEVGDTGNPSEIARIVEVKDGPDAGTTPDLVTQKSQFEYNALGNITQVTDPTTNRKTQINYASNGFDVTSVKVWNGSGWDLVRQFDYYSGTSRIWKITDEAGKVTEITEYNTKGQVQNIKDANGHFTKFTWVTDPDTSTGTTYGYVKTVQRSSNGTSWVTVLTNNAYDTHHRVTQTTDADGYTLSYLYDNLNRVTKVTYPGPGSAGSNYEQFFYSDGTNMWPDLRSHRDREGKYTYYAYNGNRQLESIQDPENGATYKTLFEWCACGDLEWIIDPRGKKTTWHRDLLGRVTAKDIADGTGGEKTYQYVFYGMSGELQGVNYPADKDTVGAVTATTAVYTYLVDGNLEKIDYGASGTPDVEFAYETRYDRLLWHKDGASAEISSSAKWDYQYHALQATGGGQLDTVDGPFTEDTLKHTYDHLGRLETRTLGWSTGAGYAFKHQIANTYDYLGRQATLVAGVGSSGPGSYGFIFQSTTSPLALRMTHPNGQYTYWNYLGHGSGRFLNTIKHWKTSTGTKISEHTYGSYTASGQIGTWQRDAALPSGSYNKTFTMSAGAYDGLYRLKNVTDTGGPNYNYQYDRSGNRISKNNGTTVYKVSDDNRLLDSDSPTNEYVFAYNTNGCMTQKKVESTGVIKANYEWDSINRLKAIEIPAMSRTEFSYDAYDRRYKMVEKAWVSGAWNGGTTSYLFWAGTELVQKRVGAHSSSINATNYYGGLGETRRSGTTNTSYFYSTDHLGSIREVTDSGKNVLAAYDYDPYGGRIRVYPTGTGGFDVEPGYTGHIYHGNSGLHLALYRAYDAEMGRWLSPDPIQEAGGLNLYGYVAGRPTSGYDPLGLDLVLQNGPQAGGLHRSVGVEGPGGDYRQSFGSSSYGDGNMDQDGFSKALCDPGQEFGKEGDGIVYQDKQSPTKTVQRFKTTPEEDEFLKAELKKDIGKSGKYNNLGNNCRRYSKKKYKDLKDKIKQRRREQRSNS